MFFIIIPFCNYYVYLSCKDDILCLFTKLFFTDGQILKFEGGGARSQPDFDA